MLQVFRIFNNWDIDKKFDSVFSETDYFFLTSLPFMRLDTSIV